MYEHLTLLFCLSYEGEGEVHKTLIMQPPEYFVYLVYFNCFM